MGNKAPYGPSGHFPQRGKICRPKIFPLWGKYRRSLGRGSFTYKKNKEGPHPTLSHRERAKKERISPRPLGGEGGVRGIHPRTSQSRSSNNPLRFTSSGSCPQGTVLINRTALTKANRAGWGLLPAHVLLQDVGLSLKECSSAGRASVSKTESRGFESPHSCHPLWRSGVARRFPDGL